MSAREILVAGLRAALEAHGPLREAVTGVFDAPPVRAARPYALIEEPLLADWGAKGVEGREGRAAVLLFDLGERPARLRALAGEAEAAIAAMPAALDDGWRIASLTLLRSRVSREGDARWIAASEWRVRMLREG